MRIAVYPGSFNPLHIGHMAIMKHLVSGMFFDQVYLVVSPKNPLKDNISADSALARFEAAREALTRHSDIPAQASPVELSMEPPYYTYRTLSYFRSASAEDSFTLVIGGDQLASFRNWKDYDKILREFGVAVFPREGYDSEADAASLLDEDPSYKIEIARDFVRVDVSSTEIREKIARGEPVDDLLM